MHSIHLEDAHVTKGQNLFALSVGVIAWSSIALFFFLVSWAVGGNDYKDSIGGNYGWAIPVLGIMIGALFAALTKPKS